MMNGGTLIDLKKYNNMKYLKKFESRTSKIDPYNEEDWGDSEDSWLDQYIEHWMSIDVSLSMFESLILLIKDEDFDYNEGLIEDMIFIIRIIGRMSKTIKDINIDNKIKEIISYINDKNIIEIERSCSEIKNIVGDN